MLSVELLSEAAELEWGRLDMLEWRRLSKDLVAHNHRRQWHKLSMTLHLWPHLRYRQNIESSCIKTNKYLFQKFIISLHLKQAIRVVGLQMIHCPLTSFTQREMTAKARN